MKVSELIESLRNVDPAYEVLIPKAVGYRTYDWCRVGSFKKHKDGWFISNGEPNAVVLWSHP